MQQFKPLTVTIVFCICANIFSNASYAKPQVYYDFPAQYLPATPTQHPRIYIKDRISALKTLYNTVPELPAVHAFKHDIDKLLTFTSATQDWRHGNGWPAAALALHWLITGNAASGQKACDVFIPHFDGMPSHTFYTDLYYALAYDWLFNHPCFTNAMKASVRTKLIAWSNDTATADDTSGYSWTAYDTDVNIAKTAGHFIPGLAILGEDRPNGLKLLKRGWTGWKYGINSNAAIPDFPITKFFRTSLETGIPLPGWDYGMMSDIRMAQNLFYVMDELGVIDAEFPDLKQWWVNSLMYFIHSIDPANTHWRWIGDQQGDVQLANSTGYIWSFLSNNVYLAQRYGQTTEAAMGRSFLDTLTHPSYGLGDGDPMLWFMTSWNNSAPRLDFKTNTQRYVLGGLGPEQHMGIGMFRSDWSASELFDDPQQVTWGGFYGIGSYIVDHMHNSAGSFWLWRNGEYLLTEPSNYGGNEGALYPFTLWNSLSIPNEAVSSENKTPDNGGPIVYFNQGSAYLERGRADTQHNVFYALLNADKSYNLTDNIWAVCTGLCRQPVSKYTRSFIYDGASEIVFLLDRVDLARTRPTGVRFRTQNPDTLSTLVSSDTVSVPSELGNYRTLIRVLTPTVADPWIIAEEPWDAVPAWQIPHSTIGSQARKNFATALRQRIVTALHIDKTSAGNTALANASMLTTTANSVGACAAAFCFVAANENATTRTAVNYTTPNTMPANSHHLVTDLDANGCYSVTSSVSGTIANELSVNGGDNTLWFVVPNSGVQNLAIVKTAANVTGCSNDTGIRLNILKSGTGLGTVTSTPLGIHCGDDCRENYASDTAVNLIASPYTSSHFTGWSGDADCIDGQVTVNLIKTCTAIFTSNPPVVVTNTPSTITRDTLQLNGTVNPNSAATSVTFDFGITTSYGTSLAATPATIAANAGVTPVIASKTGLTCDNVYHYRVKAVNSSGITYGTDRSVTTAACPIDFVITSISLNPAAPAANGTFTATVRVKNQGTVVGDGKFLDVWSHQPATRVCGAVGNQRQTIGTMAAGATKVFTFTGLPAGIAGSKMFRAFVDSGCGMAEMDENNNQSTLVYAVNQATGIDFVVTGITLTPAVSTANGTFTAAVTVKNQGTVAGDGKFLDIWSNQANGQACSAAGDKRQAVGVLAAGASKTLTFTSLSAGGAGMKMLRAFVDSGCGTAENNEGNNQRVALYAVNQATGVDFVVTTITLNPAVPTANGTFNATVTVKNQGTVTGDGKLLDVWSNQPAGQVCGATGDMRLSWSIYMLAAGASKTLSFNGLAAGAAGAKTLRVFVDSGCGTAENNEGNNQFTKAYTVQ